MRSVAPLDPHQLERFLSALGAGPLRDATPLAAGIAHRKYLVRAGAERYVVTVYEDATAEEISSAEHLASALSRRGVPVPEPIRSRGGSHPSLGGRPASLAPIVGGEAAPLPSLGHLAELGAELARFHLAGEGLGSAAGGGHLAAVLCPLARQLSLRLRPVDPSEADILEAEAEFQELVPEEELPSGLVHGALFTGNVLFREGPAGLRVAAFLGLERSGRGPWLFDLALVLSDACWTGPGVSGERARAFLAGYRTVRPIQSLEFELLPAYLRRVALRFLCLDVERRLAREKSGGDGPDPRGFDDFAAKLKLFRAGLRGASPMSTRPV